MEAEADAETDDEVVVGGVEDPAIVHANVLDTIEEARAVAEAWRKIFKASRFDPGAKGEISDAIELLIRKWRAVQSVLAASEPPPDGSGGEPEPKVDAPAETVSEPAESTIDGAAVAPKVEATDTGSPSRFPADGSLPDFMRVENRHQWGGGAPVPSVPITPPAPAPTTPAPSPSPPTSPSPKLKVSPHYLPAHKDPWPKDWRSLNAAELEDVIHKTQAFGINHRLEDRHHKQLTRMRERLVVLRKADRAERTVSGSEAVH